MATGFSLLRDRIDADREADRITNAEYATMLDAIYAAERAEQLAAENRQLRLDLVDLLAQLARTGPQAARVAYRPQPPPTSSPTEHSGTACQPPERGTP